MRAILLLAVCALALAPGALAKPGDPPFLVELDATEKLAKPQDAATFPATVASRSPERLLVTLQLVESEGRLRAVPVPDVSLAPQGQRESEVQILFLLQTPYENGRVDEVGSVTYRAVAMDPGSRTPLGDPQDVTLTVRTVGTYVPAWHAFAVCAALAVAAVLLPRRPAR